MFNFIKKAGTGVTSDKDEKEKRKRDKKDRKDKQKRERASMSAEELLRLDEVRRSLKIRGRRKEKEKLPSGITADYTADFLASLDRQESTVPHMNHLQEGHTQSDSSETSLNSLNNPQTNKVLPPLPPKPPKRGILKTPRVSVTQDNGYDNLVRNTIQNELITYQNIPNGGINGKNLGSELLVITSTSPSADSLTDTTNSSFATPPFSLSPVGESQGFHRWSRTSNFDDVELPLPEIAPLTLPKPRTLTIQRQKPPRNDFGFSLRRAMVLERVVVNGNGAAGDGTLTMKAVIFAEPGAMVQHNNETGLLPGDKLLEVNGFPVEDKTREEIIDKIKASGECVTLKVQPVAELSELSRRSAHDGGEVVLDDSNIRGGTLRRSGSRRFNKSTTAKSEEHLEKEKQWLDTEKVWLMHRGGFTAALKNGENFTEPGKIQVCLEHSKEILTVDEDDIEKANPPQFDRAEDLAALRHLNESSILHTLRQRYATNLIHTYAGCGTLLVINPMAPVAIYSEKVVALFKGCKSEDMPPHIYSMAQSCYHGMLSQRRDQSLVFLGRSGSGKTTNFRHCIQYLVTAAGCVNKILTVEKLSALWTVLESFGNCRTVMNTNATRFTQIFSLDFDQSGVIASASIQILLLEKARIARKVEGETTFHIMQRLLSGVEGGLRKELFLENLSGNENNAFFLSYEASSGNSNRYQFANPQAAQRSATLLGTSVEELSRVIFGLSSGGMVTPNTPRAPFRTPSPIDKGLEREAVGIEAIEGMAMGLYAEVFNCIASLINRSISASSHTVSSILLVDTPGFQNPATCGRQAGASFEDLCHNYLQERLQLLYHHTNLVAPKDRYMQENIDCVYDENENLINPTPLVNLMDKAAQNSVVRTSQTDLHEGDRRGLLWLLDEEAIYPGSTDDSFLERLFTHYGDRDHQLLLRKAPGNNQFILQHLQGTNPVLYTAKNWLKHSRENPISRAAVTVLQESCKEDMSKLFVSVRGLAATSFSGSLVGIEGSQSLRRASSIRRTFTAGTAAIKRKSICLQTKFTVDGLIETLRRTRLRFVHCLLPQHNAGFCEALAVKTSLGQQEDALMNIPLLRSQIRGGQILDAVRFYKQGFPNFLPLSEFRRRFRLLAGDGKISSPVLDERKAVEDMLLAVDLELSSYRVGLSQPLFGKGQLDAQNKVKQMHVRSDRFFPRDRSGSSLKSPRHDFYSKDQSDQFWTIKWPLTFWYSRQQVHIGIGKNAKSTANSTFLISRRRRDATCLRRLLAALRPTITISSRATAKRKPCAMATKCRVNNNTKTFKKQVKKSEHIYENLTYTRKKESVNNKLKIVIDNFDKILDEYKDKAVPSTKIPKLQKAKTCSIIESKCILKKSLSQPETPKNLQKPLQTKTKSLADIAQVPQPPSKVKQAVERINRLNKSKSINDVTSGLYKSRIPVKTPVLRKVFPSTPSGLNCLDRSGCAKKLTPLKRDFVNKSNNVKERSVREVVQKLEADKLGNNGRNNTYRKSAKNSPVCEKVKVKLSYSSDDNSDDSGNISNENEVDCDDVVVGPEKVKRVNVLANFLGF
nr:PREDICTED: unconventional myosin-XVIIIa [Tribolium castaneum]|eukprot:XP_015836260.1 PREDICTED: unconventional myosin-XVIIIa [Tribolium castaneum]